MKKVMTVGIIREGDKILLGMKKRGFGEGKWNGFGGKVKEGETPEDAMRREFLEEAGVAVEEMNERGVINFEFTNDELAPEVHFFDILKWSGEPRESEEMLPKWFQISEIPYDVMWADDKYWLPLFLEGKSFSGRFLFDEKGEVVEQDLKVMK